LSSVYLGGKKKFYSSTPSQTSLLRVYLLAVDSLWIWIRGDLKSSVAEPHHYYAAPAAQAPTLPYTGSRPTFLKSKKLNYGWEFLKMVFYDCNCRQCEYKKYNN
jgi:hypothetical protein